jgi:membrane-associated protein
MPTVIGTLVAGLVIGTGIGIRQYRIEMSRPAEDFDIGKPGADRAAVPACTPRGGEESA